MMFPHDAMLGLVPGRDGFYKLHRRPDARPVPGARALPDPGQPAVLRRRLRPRPAERHRATTCRRTPAWFVLDASAIVQVDSTGAAMLEEIAADFAGRGISLGIAELHTEPKALLERAGLLQRIGPAMIFEDLEDALRAFHASGGDGRSDGKNEHLDQT